MMADEPIEPINQKVQTCILRASIHCEGCKRKVKKILSQIQGVEFVDVDTKQHKVTVTGNVDADILIKKLAKSGKNAELWPQTSHTNGNNRDKEIKIEATTPSTSPLSDLDRGKTQLQPPSTNSQRSGGGSGGGGGGGGGGQVKRLDEGGLTKTNRQIDSGGDKKKSEEKKIDESCSVETPEKEEAVENSNGGGNGGESGTTASAGKTMKKKKRGQSGNFAAGGLENREPGPLPAIVESPPRNHQFPFMPPPPQLSYNTAYPTSSYTAAYYAAPPPHAYAYMHPAERDQTEPSPLDPDMNPRQPLDSFEMFSDENPNGCFIM